MGVRSVHLIGYDRAQAILPWKGETMDEKAFRAEQARRGCTEFHVRDWAPGTVNDSHAHDFAASILVLAGEITVETKDGTTTCHAGDTFSLDAGVPHTERIGPDGVRFLSARA